MADRMQGTIVELSIAPTGDEVEVDAPVGATTLVVGDVADFAEDGGQLEIEVELDEEDPESDAAVFRLTYSRVDPDNDTIILTTPLPVAAPMNTPVYVYPRSEEKWAMVDIDGWDDALLARLPHYMHADVPDGISDDGEDISAIVRLDGTEWVVDDIIGEGEELVFGNAFGAHVRLGQGGLRGFRLGEDGTTVEPTLILDSKTGNVSIIGEFGTAMPDDIGIFMFKVNSSGGSWGSRTRPVLQFNVGATRDQPSIQADTSIKSGLMLYSGANTNERESSLRLDQGTATLWIEDEANSQTIGAFLELRNGYIHGKTTDGKAYMMVGDDLKLWGRHRYGGNNYRPTIDSGLLAPGEAFFRAGLDGETNGIFQGIRVNMGASVRISSIGPLEVTNGAGDSWQSIYASELVPSSDRALKQNVTEPTISGLEILRRAPVYEWEYVSDPERRRLGPMANDLPPMMTYDLPGPDGGTAKGVGTVQQLAVLWKAVQELDAELDQVAGLREVKPERKEC